ncbi:MAG TPA: 1-deoxy-D-xylulose-5-phosphate synthase N-terminal domain-containing protein, partial [Limnochordia bacterium]|nr:1-deoxy-D-xylulose-5-phosphate synthase N-terminal domain-containing protein [Limnochordia bacterium]
MARLLDTIDQPQRLKDLTPAQLRQLAAELRDEIVTTTAQTGGHLGANLGAIEITLALHSALNSPEDKLIWDVGHQAYAHKLLTGRREAFKTLRQYGGLSGFPKRSESVHDAFGTAHAGTSVSAALGYALARDGRRESHHVVCVTGDGAMTAGMVFEALNHAGQLGTRLVVILNDNEMSISKNVGALSEYLTRVRIDPTVQRARGELEHLAQRLPGGSQVLKAVGRIKDLVEQVLVPGQLFTELGFTYYGPIDGHDIELLQRTLRQSLAKRGPVLIHAITEKGRGYQPAESDPGKLHAVKAAKAEGPAKARRVKAPTYSQVFGDA